MDELTLTLAAILTAAGAALAGGLVSGIVQAVKPALPAAWSTGRAPMLISAALSLVLVVLAITDAGLELSASTIFVALLSWYGIYSAAIGTHQTITKVGRIASGTTNTSGSDAEG